MQGHSQQTWCRCQGAIQLLDSLIRLLSLTTLDADRPEAHYAIFATSARSSGGQPMFNDHTGSYAHPFAPPEGISPQVTIDIPKLGSHTPGPVMGTATGCACLKYALKEQWPTVSEVAPLWEMTTMWPDGLHEGEIRKEECRRLVWSSVMLSAGQNGYTAADAELDRTELFIKDHRNVRAQTAVPSSGAGERLMVALIRLIDSSLYCSPGRSSASRPMGSGGRLMCGICVSARWCCGTRVCAREATLPLTHRSAQSMR